MAEAEKAEARAKAPLVVGEVVESRYGGGPDWHQGKVHMVNQGGDAGTYAVMYDDGDHEPKVKRLRIRRPGEVEPDALVEGQRCEARHGGGTAAFDGRISKVGGANIYDVSYDDGDFEAGVDRGLIYAQCVAASSGAPTESTAKTLEDIEEAARLEAEEKARQVRRNSIQAAAAAETAAAAEAEAQVQSPPELSAGARAGLMHAQSLRTLRNDGHEEPGAGEIGGMSSGAQPPREVVIAHARCLGATLSSPMPPSQESLLTIARESLSAALPEGWQVGPNGTFHNKYTGEICYEHPLDDYYRSKIARLQADGAYGYGSSAMSASGGAHQIAGLAQHSGITIDEVDERVTKAISAVLEEQRVAREQAMAEADESGLHLNPHLSVVAISALFGLAILAATMLWIDWAASNVDDNSCDLGLGSLNWKLSTSSYFGIGTVSGISIIAAAMRPTNLVFYGAMFFTVVGMVIRGIVALNASDCHKDAVLPATLVLGVDSIAVPLLQLAIMVTAKSHMHDSAAVLPM